MDDLDKIRGDEKLLNRGKQRAIYFAIIVRYYATSLFFNRSLQNIASLYKDVSLFLSPLVLQQYRDIHCCFMISSSMQIFRHLPHKHTIGHISEPAN